MSGLSRFPFTPSQFQELEHQALIFKYIINGMPIPPDLLFTIKRGCLDSTMSSKYFSHQSQHVGWNYFQMGIGKKIDPEPGRCRRTDGKKWRCSKEAYPDSKYCERHMHRGKNRSRKPVEVMTNSSANTTSSTITITNTNNTTPSITKTPLYSFNSTSQSLSSAFSSEATHHYPSSHSQYSHIGPPHSLSYHHSSSSRPHSLGLSSQDNSTSYLLDNGSYSFSQNNADYRYYYGVKENEHEHEHAFFTEPSGAMRSFSSAPMDDSWQLTPLTMSTTSSSSTKQRGFSALDSDYSYLQLQTSKQQDHHHQQHFYGLGSEVKEQQQQPKKTIHRFLDDGPMNNSRESSSWLDLDDKSSNSSSMSTTKLSISVPSSSNDFPIFNSTRQHNDG